MQGTVDVAEPTEVPLVPDNVKAVAAAMQEYLCTSPLDAFDRVTHQGVFRNLVVRAAVTGETMALLIVSEAARTSGISKNTGLLF